MEMTAIEMTATKTTANETTLAATSIATENVLPAAATTPSSTAATAFDTSVWTQEYAQAVAGNSTDHNTKPGSAAYSTAPDSSSSVRRFLESVLAAPERTPQLTLAHIGEALVVPLADLSTATLQKQHGLDRDAVLRALQLQVICRLCCCCSTKAGTKAKTKKKTAKAAKKARAAQLKLTKKEVRSLLDRIALLLDAANPPSMTDEDEHSPFHDFLERVLARAFASHVPKLVQFLLSTYELVDEARELERLTLGPVAAAASQPAVALPTPAAAAQSILSALRDEQRPLKRSRTETVMPFKKMELPSALQRCASFPSTRRDTRNITVKTRTRPAPVLVTGLSVPTTEDPLVTPVAQSSSRTTAAASTRTSSNSSSSRRSSTSTRRSVSTGSKKPQPSSTDKPRLAHHSSLGARLQSAPLLVRNVSRGLVAGPQSRFTPSATNSMPHTTATASTSSMAIRPLFGSSSSARPPPLTGLTRTASGSKPPVAAPRTAVSSLVASERSGAAVVMRTPDRPQRRAHRQSRVLIESSPPFRNPHVVGGRSSSARPRKSPSAIPPPLLR